MSEDPLSRPFESINYPALLEKSTFELSHKTSVCERIWNIRTADWSIDQEKRRLTSFSGTALVRAHQCKSSAHII